MSPEVLVSTRLVLLGLALVAGCPKKLPPEAAAAKRIRPADDAHVALVVDGDRAALARVGRGEVVGLWDLVRNDRVPGFVQICSHPQPARCLHIQNGRVEVGPVEEAWWSAWWAIEEAPEGTATIRNRWKKDLYLMGGGAAVRISRQGTSWRLEDAR